MDDFGLQREVRIGKSGVRGIFTPHMPIQSVQLFFGRQKEVGAIIQQLNTPGQHSLLFGDRGVGKSSLANIASDLLLKKFVDGKLYKKRCDSADDFLSIVSAPLADVGIDLALKSAQQSKAEGGGANIGVPGLGAKLDSMTTRVRAELVPRELATPSWVAEKLMRLSGLLLVDEVDALSNVKDRHLLAEFVKQLSDSGASLKVLLVGISETGADLIAGHPSVSRCLKETRLKRMGADELKEIIDGGEKRLRFTFSDAAKERIVAVSSGYPHFTHLLALKSAEDVLARGGNTVDIRQVEESTRRAVDDAEGTLKRSYDEAVRSHQTEEYRKVLCAAVLCGADEFSASELRAAYKKMWGAEIKQSALNNYFVKLVSERDDKIIRRLAKGVYRFSDPRMPSFIRIANPEIQTAS